MTVVGVLVSTSHAQTVVKRAFLQGSTPRIRFQILDEDGAGFQPDTLTMSVYDTSYTPTGGVRTTRPPFGSTPLADTIVNSRNDVDLSASCDTAGNVDFYLQADDTDLDVPVGMVPSVAYRRLLFIWTWDGDKVGKHEILLTITPDRETLAS